MDMLVERKLRCVAPVYMVAPRERKMNPHSNHYSAIRLWLALVSVLVFALVIVGGATRLTESGLSITEWKPVTGVLPPLSAEGWQAEFEKYQTIPQYAQRNLGMSLDDFKTIYWWEWTHRLLGRLVGAAFLIPFLFFLWRGWVEPGRLKLQLWGIFALGALQGAVGWWMVASGLVGRTEVSQYRLATHLLLASLIFSALIWVRMRLRPPDAAVIHPRVRAGAAVLVVLVLLQIYLGAVVAGLRAGLIYNTWPLIDGAFIPDASRLFFETPLWRNFFENTLTVQFNHRMTGYLVLAFAIAHAIDTARLVKRGPVVANAVMIAIAVALQAMIGIATLLEQVDPGMAMLHQGMAMLVLAFAVGRLARVTPLRGEALVSRPVPAPGPQ
jgi:cytochrome c oxidase assembly protein subunit 15